MNELVLFSLILLIFTRLIGLGTSLNFFYDLRKKFLLYFIFGWLLSIIANIIPLILDFIEDTFFSEFILVLNALIASLGMIFLIAGLFSYFVQIKFFSFILGCIIITCLAILFFFFLDYNISVAFSVIIMNLSIIVAFSFPLFKLKKFKEFVGKSIRWYYITCGTVFGYLPISIFIYTQGYGYGLYNTDDVLFIILNYTIGIVTHILLIVLLIHLEYNISNERKNQLKDKYSHNLGNIMQVIYSSSDIIKRIIKPDVNEEEKLELIEKKCKEAAKLINEIRNI
ncbi:MAG: hypothetical protein KAV01_10110 [Candidatus Lokiarchaeota archaeon]|nr:hypothetical protein [Candidatus Lokiarchaeota archaeon]